MLPELYLSVVAMVMISAALGVVLWRLNNRVSALANQLTRTAAVHSEALRMKEANDRLAEWQEVTEASIDGGTQAVRAVHKGIAAIPFSILEAIPVTRDTAKLVREVHDFTSDNVYAAISTVNRLVGESSRAYLKAPPGEKRALADAAHEKQDALKGD